MDERDVAIIVLLRGVASALRAAADDMDAITTMQVRDAYHWQEGSGQIVDQLETLVAYLRSENERLHTK